MRDRRILRLSGADAYDFLQNLVTSDLARLSDGAAYGALLTPQGKLIADFIMLRQGEDILIDVAEQVADALAQRLAMYKLRADVTIAEADLHVRRGTGPAPAGALADPRHPALGWRLYGDEQGDDGSDWDAIRVAHCIPATGIELTPDTYILEAGFERLNGVDFRKGCYVGQEIAARMKHKTELRKGLVTVALSGTATPGTEITRDGKTIGRLHTVAGDRAIAYLRFDRAGPGMQAGSAQVSMDG
ncbi:YgfZ/GcvT domain-containing protein [Pseudooceanicola aestuarii]|uniref:CAF17-like 4Fe-4S cluster assembly/insertion protein YgfZ n=1 Tax=Pseudooceanicola aestuarii TaxID=2697319 RepID=UPI0013D678FF|nr:folate-binding protein YgfZ [Pseudooceanicola aestuarii]